MYIFSQEVHQEFNAPPEPVEYKSVTATDFNIEGFVPQEQLPTAVSQTQDTEAAVNT